MFSGYKTYVLAALAVAYGIIGFYSGWIDSTQSLQVIWSGLAAAGIRSGIAAVAAK